MKDTSQKKKKKKKTELFSAENFKLWASCVHLTSCLEVRVVKLRVLVNASVNPDFWWSRGHFTYLCDFLNSECNLAFLGIRRHSRSFCALRI